jgi:hypothetical protein
VNRNRLVAVTLVLACGVLGQAGIASAEGEITNAPPVAHDDPAAGGPALTVEAGKSLPIDVLANDEDPEGQPLTVASVIDPSGRAKLVEGAVVFTARSTDGNTKPTFTYTASDGALSSEPATVTVTVTAPPPPPAPRKVTISMPSTVVALRPYSIHGTVNNLGKAPVDVVVQRLSGTRWVAYKTDRADAGGAYAVSFSTNKPKRFVFRAVATWRDGKKAATGKLARTVVARADATVSGPLSARDVPYSYRSGCPVAPSGLRRITINRFNYSRVVARGSLIVRASAVPDLLRVFKASFNARFPVRSMKPSDAFYAGGSRTPTQSDVAAMRADNTSAFNCRPVTGNPYRVSQHSYGNAIDINTVRNPYVVGSRVYPDFARTYLDRSNVRTGMITRRGVIATQMRQLGWPWGARWSHPDYQHFSSNGG